MLCGRIFFWKFVIVIFVVPSWLIFLMLTSLFTLGFLFEPVCVAWDLLSCGILCVKSQMSADLIYTAEEAWNHACGVCLTSNMGLGSFTVPITSLDANLFCAILHQPIYAQDKYIHELLWHFYMFRHRGDIIRESLMLAHRCRNVL
jgi:hypothetical protein